MLVSGSVSAKNIVVWSQVAQADRQTDKEYMGILRKIHGYF